MKTSVALAAPETEATQPSAFQVAFNGAFEAFTELSSQHGDNKTVSAASAAILAAAKRAVCWAAFDLAGDDTEQAEALAVTIATTDGVKPENMPVYRLRARDCIAFASQVKAADRAKVNPYTLAKKLRVTASAETARLSAAAPFTADALEMVAGEMQTTLANLAGLLAMGDTQAHTLFAAALTTVKERATLIADFKAIMARIAVADDATKAACGFSV